MTNEDIGSVSDQTHRSVDDDSGHNDVTIYCPICGYDFLLIPDDNPSCPVCERGEYESDEVNAPGA